MIKIGKSNQPFDFVQEAFLRWLLFDSGQGTESKLEVNLMQSIIKNGVRR